MPLSGGVPAVTCTGIRQVQTKLRPSAQHYAHTHTQQQYLSWPGSVLPRDHDDTRLIGHNPHQGKATRGQEKVSWNRISGPNHHSLAPHGSLAKRLHAQILKPLHYHYTRKDAAPSSARKRDAACLGQRDRG